jgi:hypothetical protein
MGLGAMIEKAAKQMQEDLVRKESNDGAEDDEEAMEDELFAEAIDSPVSVDDMYELLEQEDEYGEADMFLLEGEGR